MPFDSNGIWSLTPGYLAVTGQVVSPTNHNPPLEDISTNGLSAVLVRDGRAPMTGALNMGTTNKITNLATGTLATDAVNKAQLDASIGSPVQYVAQTLTPAQQGIARSNISAALRGNVFGLTLTPNGSDAANDVDIAAGEIASSETDPVLMVLSSALTKRIDANWVVGTNQGGLDTGSVSAAATYYLWLIRRSDTGVVDALFSLSATAPTMPAAYDQKRLLAVVGRGGSVNGYPNTLVEKGLRYGGNFSLLGLTSVTILGVPSNAKRVTLVEEANSLNGSANPFIRIGPSSGVVSAGYLSNSLSIAAPNTVAGATYTTAFGSSSGAAANTVTGKITLSLENPSTNLWVLDGTLMIEGSATVLTQAGRITLSGLLDRIQITTSNGTDTYDSGTITVYYE